jgi:hypothetical protein
VEWWGRWGAGGSKKLTTSVFSGHRFLYARRHRRITEPRAEQKASPACCVCYSLPSYLKDTLILVR